MKQDQVTIGRTYLAKVSDKVVPVRIDRAHPAKGWFGTNMVTNKQVRIKSAQRLRGEVKRDHKPDQEWVADPCEPEAEQRPDPPVESNHVATTPTADAATGPVSQTSPAASADAETTPRLYDPARTPSYDERLMFAGATDPAAAREALANPITPCGTEKNVKTKKKTSTASPKAKAPAKTKPDAKADKKMSALDAAAKVLGEKGDAMTTGEMIETMAKKGYWTSPGGKTPAATLYAAILREINVKGKESRFSKTERGKFKVA